jgi:hypothetical protein
VVLPALRIFGGVLVLIIVTSIVTRVNYLANRIPYTISLDDK